MMSATITVLMPVYNAEQFLREAMDSILNQSFRDIEFLIIDDGSTDASISMIQQYQDGVIGDIPESELTVIKNTQGLVRGLGDHAIYDALYKNVKSIADEINIRISYSIHIIDRTHYTCVQGRYVCSGVTHNTLQL